MRMSHSIIEGNHTLVSRVWITVKCQVEVIREGCLVHHRIIDLGIRRHFGAVLAGTEHKSRASEN